jgi:hypothetical protein
MVQRYVRHARDATAEIAVSRSSVVRHVADGDGGVEYELVHVSGGEFLKLMADAPRGQISHHA